MLLLITTAVMVACCRPDRTKSTLAYMQQHGYHEEVLDGLLNLDLALQCDGFVSSFTSNWARLIEELRSTVRCKADAMLVDVDPALSLNATPLEGIWPYSSNCNVVYW